MTTSNNKGVHPTARHLGSPPATRGTQDGVVTLNRIPWDPGRMGGAPFLCELRITESVLGQTPDEVRELRPYVQPDEDITPAFAYGEARNVVPDR